MYKMVIGNSRTSFIVKNKFENKHKRLSMVFGPSHTINRW